LTGADLDHRFPGRRSDRLDDSFDVALVPEEALALGARGVKSLASRASRSRHAGRIARASRRLGPLSL
jgi:hypothetical protein